MENKILLIIAQAEEFEYFTKSLHLKSTSIPFQSNNIKEHEIKTLKNGVLRFTSYTLPEIGPNSVLMNLPNIIKSVNPEIIINLGIAGRVDKHYNIGDVIIGDILYSFTDNSKARDGELGMTIDPNIHTFTPTKTYFENIDEKEDQINPFSQTYEKYEYSYFTKEEIKIIEAIENASLVKGPIVSGPWVDVSDYLKSVYSKMNRKIAVVDMEAAQIQQIIDQINDEFNKNIKSIYIKGISDLATVDSKDHTPAFNNKTNRKYSLFNAAMIFKRFVNNEVLITPIIPFDYKYIDEIFNKTHLSEKQHFKNYKDKNSESIVNSFSRLFYLLFEKNEILNNASALFDDFVNLVKSSKTNSTIKITGFSGSGKSSFLISLFLNFYSNFTKDQDVFPIYLNLDHYYTKHKNKNIDLHTYVLKSFELDIHNAEKILNQLNAKKIILFIDGVDYIRESDSLLDYFHHLKFFKNLDVTIVYGIQSIPEHSILNYPKINNQIQTTYEFNLRSFTISDPEVADIINIFVEINENENAKKAQKIFDLLKNSKIQEIDLFLISLIYDKINSPSIKVHNIIRDYCHNIAREQGLEYPVLLSNAFVHHIERPSNDSNTSNDYYNSNWKLIHQNPKISYFLIAEFVISKILLVTESNDKTINSDLGFVFPFQINYFCKEIINESLDKQQNVFSKIKIILKSDNLHSIAVACYLAGRFTDDSIQTNSKKLLKDFLNSSTNNTNWIERDKEKFLFALRTIYISLTYLGDKQIEDEYIQYLLRDKNWDDINRGFHLVYYGDQEYIPKNGLAQSDYLKYFKKTADQLIMRIENKDKSKLYNIELFTLISLTVHRLNSPYLQLPELTRILSIITNPNYLDKIDNLNVSNFTSYTKNILQKDKFTLFTPIEEVYNLKFTKRAGWVKRNLSDIESVACHTLLAYFIAKFYLPETSNDLKNYNKNLILEMLLIHDIAESRIGDIINKSETDRENERNYYKELKWVSYILPNCNTLYSSEELFEDFENGKTVNGEIAKEIDRIEAFTQLLLYKHKRNENLSEEQIKEWEKGFIGVKSLKFEITRNIFELIKKHYY